MVHHTYALLSTIKTPYTDHIPERPREPYLQRIDSLRPRLPRHASRDKVHVQDQPALRQPSERKGAMTKGVDAVCMLTRPGRCVKAAMSGSVEAGLHHGDDTDRASKVRTSPDSYCARLTGFQVHGAAAEQEASPAARGSHILRTSSTRPVPRRQSWAG